MLNKNSNNFSVLSDILYDMGTYDISNKTCQAELDLVVWN